MDPDKEEGVLTELSSWTDTQWKDFVQEASNQELAAIIEKARRITLFRRSVQRYPSRWNNQDWSIVSKQVIGIGRTTCAQYETIYRVFGHLSSQEPLSGEQEKLRSGLPSTMYSLYLIAGAYEDDSEMAMVFIGNGTCHAGLTQKLAKAIREAITQKKAGKTSWGELSDEVLARERDDDDELDNDNNDEETIAEDDKPQRDQVARQDKRPKFEAQMEEAILRGLYRYRTETKMLDEALTYFVHQWIEHLSLIDLLQDFRKKYGDADMVHALKWLLEIIEDSGKSGADNLWNRGAVGANDDEEPEEDR
jgi:hypothetical protein